MKRNVLIALLLTAGAALLTLWILRRIRRKR